MKNKATIKKILIGLIIAIVVLIGYSMFSSNSANFGVAKGGLSSTLGSASIGQIDETDTAVANAEILRILGSIEHIELHDDIFVNPIFRKLKDANFAIPRPSIIGRKNPFLPIGFKTADDLQQIQENEQQIGQGEQSSDFFSDLNENINP